MKVLKDEDVPVPLAVLIYRTLRAHLPKGMSIKRFSTQLGMHESTVRNACAGRRGIKQSGWSRWEGAFPELQGMATFDKPVLRGQRFAQPTAACLDAYKQLKAQGLDFTYFDAPPRGYGKGQNSILRTPEQVKNTELLERSLRKPVFAPTSVEQPTDSPSPEEEKVPSSAGGKHKKRKTVVAKGKRVVVAVDVAARRKKDRERMRRLRAAWKEADKQPARGKKRRTVKDKRMLSPEAAERERTRKREYWRRKHAVGQNTQVKRPVPVEAMLGASLLLLDPELLAMMEPLFSYLLEHSLSLRDLVEAAKSNQSYRRVLSLQ